MQFNSNSDFPGNSIHTLQWAQIARPPIQFETADFIPCAYITTRVIIKCDDTLANQGINSGDAQHVEVGGLNYIVKTAKGVLVRTATTNNNGQTIQGGDAVGGGWSDSSSSDSDMEDGDKAGQSSAQNNNGIGFIPQAPRSNTSHENNIERAYWLRRTLRTAIYGQVRYGIVLHRLSPPVQVVLPNTNELVSIEWEETNTSVAIKEMNWDHIHSQRDRLAEDPIKEVAAMQYLRRWLLNEQEKQNALQLMQQLQLSMAASGGNIDMNAQLAGMNAQLAGMNASAQQPFVNNNSQWIGQQQQQQEVGGVHIPQAAASVIHQTPQNMLESHIMMPMDLLSDNRNLYSIMPYCAGGELFEVLEKKNRFTETEARYWMRQILKGLSCLKKAGVAHRDLSLENLLVHEGNVLVIDMGMCLRVPFVDQSMNQRYLILPQGVCGKWHYMSPEVCKNQLPFDGPAVDLWAVGVILFLMLTGFPPWERPTLTDERFRYMSNGYLVQMLTEWQLGLSADAMDLLQRMFWLDPTDRLSLEQVCAHPWMNQ